MKLLEEFRRSKVGRVPTVETRVTPIQTPVETPVEDVIPISKIITKQQRMEAIQDLVSKIPADKAGLWEWNVKWEHLSDSILDQKLEPFLRKKAKEFVGEEEDVGLVNFILSQIKSKCSAEEIHVELLPVLLEEAELFVKKLWRMLIFETESRSLFNIN